MFPVLAAIAPLAQLDRASGYEPGGRRFESCRARHINYVSYSLYMSYKNTSSRRIRFYQQGKPGTSGTRRDDQHPGAWRHVEGVRNTEG